MSALRTLRTPTLRLLPYTSTYTPSFSVPSTSRTLSTTTTRQLTQSTALRSGDSHESHYDPPSGWLWGIPPGQKYEKEGWETIWYYGFCGSLGVAAVAYAFKPDTSIETWALEEATRRLQKEGILPDENPES